MARLLTTMVIEVHAGSYDAAMVWLNETAATLRADTDDGRELLAAIRAAVAAALPATKEDEKP